MARTTPRTQRIIGMIFDRLASTVADFDLHYPHEVNDRVWDDDLQHDDDYSAAISIVYALLEKESNKNNNRSAGAHSFHLRDLSDRRLELMENVKEA